MVLGFGSVPNPHRDHVGFTAKRYSCLCMEAEGWAEPAALRVLRALRCAMFFKA